MYIAPRPDVNDDPLFAIRLAGMGLIAFALIPFLQPQVPSVLVSLPIGLLAGMRRSFNPAKAFGGPIAFVMMIWLLSGIVELLRPMPSLLVIVMGAFYFAGFYLIQRTGNPIGMLIVMVTALTSIMGLNSVPQLEALRNSFTVAAIVTLFAIPLLYALFPPLAEDRLIELYTPAPGFHGRAAAIRTVVQLLLSLWLYTVVNASNMMLVMAATFVLVFPTRNTLFAEAAQRGVATVLGACAAAMILFFMAVVNAHYLVLLLLVLLVGLFFGSRMMRGRYPAMVYQFALSVTFALVAGALSTQEPGYAAITRVVLTLAGAAAAAFLTAALQTLFIPQLPSDRSRPASR